MKNVIAIAAIFAVALVGCSESGTSDSSKPVGSLSANLVTPEGYTINAINYSIENALVGVDQNGTVNVANSATAQFRIGSLPQGAGYNIALAATATSAGGESVQCAGTSTFAIAANTVTTLRMQLRCGDGVSVEINENGDVRVIVEVVIEPGVVCPVVTGITAIPLEVYVGATLQLAGGATSTDGVTYAWTGAGGSFSAASAAATGFTCGTAGDHDLLFTISKAGCESSSLDVTVTCTPVADPTAGDPTAGDPTAGDPTAGDPTAGDPTAGDPTAGDPTAGDPTAGDPTAGDPTAGDPTAGDPTSGEPPTGLAALRASRPSCEACVQANCGETYDVDVAGPCFYDGISPAFSQACIDAHVCSTLSEDRCATNAILGPIECYCGVGVDPTACRQGTVLGNCIPEWERATECAAGDYVCVFERFGDATLPSGFAKFNLECQLSACESVCF